MIHHIYGDIYRNLYYTNYFTRDHHTFTIKAYKHEYFKISAQFNRCGIGVVH